MPQDYKGLPKAKLRAIQDNAREQFDFIEGVPKRLAKGVYTAVEQVPFVGKVASKGIKAVENAVAQPMLDQQKSLQQTYQKAKIAEMKQTADKMLKGFAEEKKQRDYGKTALGGSPSYPGQARISKLMGVKVEKFKR